VRQEIEAYIKAAEERERVSGVRAKLDAAQVRRAEARRARAALRLAEAADAPGRARALAEAEDDVEVAHAIADRSSDEADEARNIAAHARALLVGDWSFLVGPEVARLEVKAG
jgi:hypothetical protein